MNRNKFLVGTALAGPALVAGLLAGVLPVTGSVGEVSSARAAAAIAGVPPKPYAAGAVQIDPFDLVDRGAVEVTVDPVDDLVATVVRVTGAGDAAITGGGVTVVPAGPSTASATVSLAEAVAPSDPSDPSTAAVAAASTTTVTATLTGRTPDGAPRSSSATVWVDEFAGETLVSAVGEQDLRLQRVDVLRRSGTVTADEAEALGETILGATDATERVTEGGCTFPAVCVQGTVRWTDSAGGLHPVDRATVQVRDDEAGVDQVVTTLQTDASGFFSAVIDNNDGDATGRDVYVRVLANGPGFTIGQHINSGVTVDVAGGSAITKNLTANNTADNNTAFSVHAALVVAADEVVARRGSLFPTVPVVFPSDGSYYDGTTLNLLAPDRFDWDVALHEFAHYVADRLNIEDNPGGPHNDTNLSDLRGSKSIGVRLAWGEGWPTYFAVATLHERAAGLGIPNIGDTRYQDTEDADLDDDLEANATLGEDNERTVMNILWDLYDAPNDNRDQVTLGLDPVWDTIDAGDPDTLSDAYQLFSPGRATEGTNCIFSQMNVSPKIAGQSTTVTQARPTISWRRGNGGTHPNNRFSVKFRSAGDVLLLATPTLRTNTFRPSRAQWDAILAGAGGTVAISVVGRQADDPATGPYRSCTRSYTID